MKYQLKISAPFSKSCFSSGTALFVGKIREFFFFLFRSESKVGTIHWYERLFLSFNWNVYENKCLSALFFYLTGTANSAQGTEVVKRVLPFAKCGRCDIHGRECMMHTHTHVSRIRSVNVCTLHINGFGMLTHYDIEYRRMCYAYNA